MAKSTPVEAPRETAIVSSILAQLKLRRVLCWRANSGTIVMPAAAGARRRVVRGAPAGTPDVIGVLPEWIWGSRRALFFAIEVKRPGERLRESQIAWKEVAEQHGMLWGMATSAADALELYDRWMDELGSARRRSER